MGYKGFLYSQIGYELRQKKTAVIRGDREDFLDSQARFTIFDSLERPVFSGDAAYWGAAWGSHWWLLDFSPLQDRGSYTIEVYDQDRMRYRSDPILIALNLLWNQTIDTVAIRQMSLRAQLARNQTGWKDCGTDWREANSHASTIIGLTDLLNGGFEWLSKEQNQELVRQLMIGCDYLALCQDKAEQIGLPAGAVVHEIPNHLLVIPGDVAQFIVALARTSRLISDYDLTKSQEYLERAEKAFLFFRDKLKPFGAQGFSASNHGAPPDYVVPDAYMTRDLLMLAWGALELCQSGQMAYKQDAIDLARQVMDRQIPEDAAEDGLYGHFYTFPDCGFSEKLNAHHHVGHDTGSTFSAYLIPLLDMCSRFYDHPDLPRWRRCIENFAYGYLLPACRSNPYNLIPMGYFQGQGLLTFCGPWHGVNVSYCFGATLAIKLASFCKDKCFVDIATANLQWIAGLHSGITRESFAGCVRWHEDIPDDAAIPMSQIQDIGTRSVRIWSEIPGSIANGFATNIQFNLATEPLAENDRPTYYGDEDWIPPAGAWASALTALRQYESFAQTYFEDLEGGQ